MNLDEPVHLVEYDAHWPAAFAAERRRLCEALAVPESDIEHIGSTAVAGCQSKPIIDLMLGVATYPPPAAITSKIVHLGYENLGEAGVPERLYFRRRVVKAYNLQVVRRPHLWICVFQGWKFFYPAISIHGLHALLWTGLLGVCVGHVLKSQDKRITNLEKNISKGEDA